MMRGGTLELVATSDLDPRLAPDRALVGILRLWLQHRDELVTRSLRLLDYHEADAEDAVANSLLRLLENYKRLGSIQNPKALFHRLVFNSCMDVHRRRRGTQYVSLGELDNEADARDATTEARYHEMELERLLVAAFSSLPSDLRKLLVARANGTSYSVISQQVGITQANARKRVQQARAILRRHLGRDS
ncbi:MAG TPA: sigma-70 family RNA polymerase sigma factor [Kofleriaceae bacterium]|nr:sigma-70 family RNA polymerase sigma factor [Kofleriaceae bacterium]